MKIVVFWATNPITLEPEVIDSSEWKNLPKKPEPRNPSGTEILDLQKGWIHSVSVFGRYFKADHIAILENPVGHPQGSIKVVKWDDDEEERTPDEVIATELIVEPPKLKKFNKKMKWSAIQRMTWFIPEKMKVEMEGKKQLPIYNQGVKELVFPFTDFVKPDENLVRHGIWESESNNAQMENVEAVPYREFV